MQVAYPLRARILRDTDFYFRTLELVGEPALNEPTIANITTVLKIE